MNFYNILKEEDATINDILLAEGHYVKSMYFVPVDVEESGQKLKGKMITVGNSKDVYSDGENPDFIDVIIGKIRNKQQLTKSENDTFVEYSRIQKNLFNAVSMITKGMSVLFDTKIQDINKRIIKHKMKIAIVDYNIPLIYMSEGENVIFKNDFDKIKQISNGMRESLENDLSKKKAQLFYNNLYKALFSKTNKEIKNEKNRLVN